jgi:hypothetical protein
LPTAKAGDGSAVCPSELAFNTGGAVVGAGAGPGPGSFNESACATSGNPAARQTLSSHWGYLRKLVNEFMTDLLDLSSASVVLTALHWNTGSAHAPLMGMETALSLLRFGLRQTNDARAILPASLFL